MPHGGMGVRVQVDPERVIELNIAFTVPSVAESAAMAMASGENLPFLA